MYIYAHTYVVSVLHSKKKLCLRSLYSAKTNLNQFQFQYNFTICYNWARRTCTVISGQLWTARCTLLFLFFFSFLWFLFASSFRHCSAQLWRMRRRLVKCETSPQTVVETHSFIKIQLESRLYDKIQNYDQREYQQSLWLYFTDHTDALPWAPLLRLEAHRFIGSIIQPEAVASGGSEQQSWTGHQLCPVWWRKQQGWGGLGASTRSFSGWSQNRKRIKIERWSGKSLRVIQPQWRGDQRSFPQFCTLPTLRQWQL